MRVILSGLLILFAGNCVAEDRFFANQSRQAKAPTAFVLQPPAAAYLGQMREATRRDAEALVAAIQEDPQLIAAIKGWARLDFEAQKPWLEKIFALETRLMDIKPPKLIIDTDSYPGKTVFFDFDPNLPGTGTVYLNPDKLAKREPFDALAFLIHETRHSWQFQMAFAARHQVAKAYQSAFRAQKQMSGLSFSDFLTLVNEYEAFQFGNYVLGKLTDWQYDSLGMGTFASQFDAKGKLKIDLSLLHRHGGKGSTLQRYNELAKQQDRLLKARKH